MSSIADVQLQTIKSSFLKILEIGKSNCDGSTIIVLSILGQMDSSLVKAALKERVVEIIETESSETMEASINEALRRHLLPPISEEVSPRAVELQMAAATAKQALLSSSSAALPSSQMAQPAKVEPKESKAKAFASYPPKILALAKEAGMTTYKQLTDSLQLVRTDGRFCCIFKDNQGDPALIKLLELLKPAAHNKEIALFLGGAFASYEYQGYVYGLDDEALYLLTGFMKFCMENATGTENQIKENQIRLLSYLNNIDFLEKELLPDITKIFKADIESGIKEAQEISTKTGLFLAQYMQCRKVKMKSSEMWSKIDLFQDSYWWETFCNTLLLASFDRIRHRLSVTAEATIIKGINGSWSDPDVQKGSEEISVDMRNNEFVKAAMIAMPKIPKDVFTLFHVESNLWADFLSNLFAAVEKERQRTFLL